MSYKEVNTNIQLFQTQGPIKVDTVIEVGATIGILTKTITAYVVNTNLNYILLSLPHMILFNLELNLQSKQVFQNGRNLTVYGVDTPQTESQSYHLNMIDNFINQTSKSKQNNYNDADFYSFSKNMNNVFGNNNENKICVNSVCMQEECNGDVNNPLQYPQDGTLPNLLDFKNPLTIQENLPASVNADQNKELAFLVQSFEHIFSKHKYDIGCIRMEPAKVIFNSEVAVSLRPYRASQKESRDKKSN